MFLPRDTTYSRTETGSFVPDDQPDSLANEIRCAHVYLKYEIRDWSVVSTMAGTPDKAPERKAFDFHEAYAPRKEIRLHLRNDRRRLHTIRTEGTAAIQGDFSFRINGNKEGATEGYLQHQPAWQSKDGLDSSPEAIFGGISLPNDQFEWLLGELEKPNARLHLRLIAPLYKEAIALSFDRPEYSQDIFLPYDELITLRGFDFSVVYGAQVPPELETPLHEYEDVTLAEPEPEPEPEPSPPAPLSVVRDPRLNSIILLLIALIIAVWVRR